MGRKGDESTKTGPAQRLYAEGFTLDNIATTLDTSVTSLARWKEKSRVPGAELDGWDIARQNNRPLLARLEALLEREIEYAEGCQAGSINPTAVDAMSKFGAIVKRLKDDERKEAERIRQLHIASEQKAEFDQAAVFIDNLEFFLMKLKEFDPSAISTIVEILPRITESFKATLQ